VSEVTAIRAEPRRRLIPAAVLALAAAIVATLLVPSGGRAARGDAEVVKVMTRNLYLGADLGPAIAASSSSEFIRENGEILRNVVANKFPVRARGLAGEIRRKRPDLVGLQEVSLWRTGEADPSVPFTGEFKATNVLVDYLKVLMGKLNAGKKRYRVVHVQPEFDFEAPADYDDNPSTGPGGGEINGRLTMRDVILARVGAGVQTKAAKGEQFETLYTATVAGVVPVSVERGWNQVNAKVRGSRSFRFVNTHLEAFGDPRVREAQAKELIAKGGPARGPLPVVLVGDLNSDDNTVQGQDRLAYLALKKRGFRDRATESPMSCCLDYTGDTDVITANVGSRSDFDHHIDHVLTNRPAKVKRLASSVTGLSPERGFWNSDHAGVFSKLRILP
jgi:Endonuclease/Exonuclease/phosphatase family